MSAKIASRMDRMAPSGIRKVNEKALAMERAGETVIHFEIGRPDFDTPEYIKKAAFQALSEGRVHYTSNFGLMELRQAIADKLNRENGIGYKPSEVLVTVGLSEAVFAVLAAILTVLLAALMIVFTFAPPNSILFADLSGGVRTFLTIPV